MDLVSVAYNKFDVFGFRHGAAERVSDVQVGFSRWPDYIGYPEEIIARLPLIALCSVGLENPL